MALNDGLGTPVALSTSALCSTPVGPKVEQGTRVLRISRIELRPRPRGENARAKGDLGQQAELIGRPSPPSITWEFDSHRSGIVRARGMRKLTWAESIQNSVSDVYMDGRQNLPAAVLERGFKLG
jgi:hypothetical protein